MATTPLRSAFAQFDIIVSGASLVLVSCFSACGSSDASWMATPPGASSGSSSGASSSSGGNSASGGSAGSSGGTDSGAGSSSGTSSGGDSGTPDSGGRGEGGGPTGPAWVNLDSSVAKSAPSGGAVGGRVIAIRVHPHNADVVYSGSANGGVWKSTDFTSATAHWTPITDGAEMTAIGGLDLDPQSPDTVYVALGGYDYNEMNGARMIKSTDGGATWSPSVPLAGANVVRDVRVDPQSSSIVMVASNAGLFRSTDAGAHYALVTLPNAGGARTSDNVWSLAYLGAAAGGASAWVASGHCNSGCNGDLWRSVDSGATWSSGRSANAFPTNPDVKEMTAAAGTASDPNTAAVYVLANSVNSTTVVFRSTDGGQTYTAISGSLTNANDCHTTADTMGGQGWFNQAIAVDPTDSNHVIFGGQLCSVRSLDGLSATPTFSQASSWLGHNDAPYVHADWHALLVTAIGGTVRTYSGNDGGFFSTTNLWSTPQGSEGSIDWRNHNAGMDTQLDDSMACGDPMQGNPGVVMSGMADNGTDFGVSASGGWTFYQALGGDGSGSAINKGSAGEFFWGGVPNNAWIGCSGTESSCSDGHNWNQHSPTWPSGDAPGFGRFAADPTDPSGGVTLGASSHNLWRSDTSMSWTLITGTHCDTNNNCSSGNFSATTTRVFVSQTIAGQYGAGFDDGTAAVSSDGTSASPHWTVSVGVPVSGGVANVAFPASVASGTNAGDTYVAVVDSQDTPSKGHIFVTKDRGATWTSLAGTGLPNVGVRSARFDPSDSSNKTIYAGTNVGVYRSTDGGTTWARYGSGLPNMIVADLQVALDGSLVRIGTRGRGVWEISTR